MSLNPFQQWCVRSNVQRVTGGEATADEIDKTLRANGYPSIADAVAKALR
jgi:hypothetical protein